MRRASIALVVGLASLSAVGQDYPSKPVRIIVGFPPGSSTDVVTRIVAQKLGEVWSQPVVVENRGGAGGNVAAQAVSKMPADGYTVLSTSNAIAINLTLFREPGFSANDFVPVVRTGETAATIAVHPTIAANNLRELLALAKTQPLSYASAGTGTGGHIMMEWLKKQANVDITHVPFAPATAANAVVGNQATMGLVSLPPITPHLRAGRVKVLAVTSERRAAAVPDIPTVAESGYPGFYDALWLAWFAPAGTPAAVVDRINTSVNRVVAMSDVKERLTGAGVESRPNNVAEWTAEFRDEVAKFRKVIPELGVKPD